MIRRFYAFVAIALFALAAGCSTNTDLSGVRVPNSRPDTRITGQPPSLLEASFAVDLNWTGSDPDGLVVGYEWKISNNGTDGISPRDTLTIDPLTGAVLHPWRFTAGNDTILMVLADQDSFARDLHSEPRSFRTHSFFIRAVDDKGAVDPTPAYISFTSTTIVPTCRVKYARLDEDEAQAVPSSVNIGWSGEDLDFELRVPTQVRFLWKSAQYGTTDLGDPLYIRLPFEYYAHYEEVLDINDPDWSQWRGYAALEEDRMVKFPNQPDREYFLFAVQVRDTAGAVSVGMEYQLQVANLRIKDGGFRPAVAIAEPFLGAPTSSEIFNEIAGSQPLNFSWSGDASDYNGKIVSYRHGWDLTDPEDSSDPGWVVPPGLSKQNLFAVETAFKDGLHTFYLRVVDDSDQVRLIIWRLQVIPFITYENQRDLLVIDQLYDPDGQTNNWIDQGGFPRNSELYRNAYWHFLAEGSGGVARMDWGQDFKDHRDLVTYADVVGYRAVLCFALFNDLNQFMFAQFRPKLGVDQFVWLNPYQEKGGNFFLVGGSSMESFIEYSSRYMVPMLFDSKQTYFLLGGDQYVVGFGYDELPDGTEEQRGPRMYPYLTAGIAALDWTSTPSKSIYGRSVAVKFDRKSDCVGLKAVVLDSLFKLNHNIGPGVVADTMLTSKIIDWHDVVDAQGDTLALINSGYQFSFRNDEFYDENISPRQDQPILQKCDVLEAPDGMCVEPMFKGISRFDWVREYMWNKDDPDPDWPQSVYPEGRDLDEACGSFALLGYQGRDRSTSRTNGLTYGFMSYKMIEDKPSRKADVFWGFDPYRFDGDDSRKAVRWVLQYFGLTLNP